MLVAVLAGLLLVPAASASRPHRVQLALVPLPKAALGAAAQSFALAHDSGPVSNGSAAAHTADATPATFKRLGRLNGYALEYGNAFTGARASRTSARASSSTRPRRTRGRALPSGRSRTPGSRGSTTSRSRSRARR